MILYYIIVRKIQTFYLALHWVRSNDLGLWLSNGAILIYHATIGNQLVELYLFCHRVPLYKVSAAPVWG